MPNTLFQNITSTRLLDKKPEGLEIAGWDDRDIMFIEAVAVHEGVNGNDALMERADLNRAYDSFRGKPLKIRFLNNNPTGHGYNQQTGEFDDLVRAIGTIYSAEPRIVTADGEIISQWRDNFLEEEGQYQIVVYIGVWQKYYPEIAMRLRQLHASGELAFSIEAEREFEVTPEGYRRCFNILFNGLAVVKTPAFEDAKSLMVAELLKEGGKNNMDFEKLYNEAKARNEELAGLLATEKADKEKAQGELAQTQTKNTELSEQLLEKDGEVKTISAELKTFKDEKELAEKKATGEQRLTKLKKYGDTDKTADELAELTKEAFVDILAEAVENFSPTGQENASKDDDGIVGAYHNTDAREKSNDKDNLLGIVTGLLK